MPRKAKEISSDSTAPTLYGIYSSNRTASDLWGKNQFNSSFPASLACWMRDNEINPVYIETSVVDGKMAAKPTERLSWNDIFQTTLPNSKLTFLFEAPFRPYERYIHLDEERLDNIDLIVFDRSVPDERGYLRPLEVKLTVLPDNATCEYDMSQWSSELVVRPATTSYAALGIFHSIPEEELSLARSIVEPVAIRVRDWSTHPAILLHKDAILDALEQFYKAFAKYQQPFLMQPVWKTKGKSPELADQAFDIFIWSDYSLCRTFIDKAHEEERGDQVSRYMRSCARLLRCLNDLVTTNKVLITRIYRAMDLDNQTDKEFSLSGRGTLPYLSCERLATPKVPKSDLASIILNGGEGMLSPERRFDASIFFTAKHLFDK